MRRAVRWSTRGGILALLALAVLDPPVPGAGPRRRVYLIDASASVARSGVVEAFSPEDALRLAALDLKSMRPGDRVALVAFGAKPVVLVPPSPASEAKFPLRIEGVDASSTDLGAALETAQALADGGEIVLFSDGRSTSGAPVLEKISVPVHSFPLGPLGGVDASIAAIDAPASAPPGASFPLRVAVEATGPWRGDLIVASGSNEVRHRVEFTGPGRQDVVTQATAVAPETRLALRLAGAGPDLCPENDEARLTVWAESPALRVLIVNSAGPSGLASAFRDPEWLAVAAADLRDAASSDVVILERLRADAVSRADLDRLGRLVRDEGAGLVMLGGSSAFALGGWAGTPVEELLPFWAFPDERSAVVIALDKSGSMGEPAERPRLRVAAEAVRRALELTHDDDELGLIAFSGDSEIRLNLVPGRDRGRAAGALGGIVAGGSTKIAPALKLAGTVVRTAKAGLRRILLVTDTQSRDEEDAIRREARLLREDGIGITIVRIGESTTPALAILRAAGAEEIDASDFAALEARLAEALARGRDLVAAPKAGLAFFSSLGDLKGGARPEQINRASLKPGAEVLARAGDAPAAAIRPAGRGKAAAATIALEEGWFSRWPEWPVFVARLAGAVAPPAGRLPLDVSVRFEDDRLEITARRRDAKRPDQFDVHLDGAPVRLVRRGENTYTKTLKHLSLAATVRVDGRVAAVARRPHPPEFDRVGPDEASLGRLAEATGGARLASPGDLAALPGRSPAEPRSARLLFLAAALVLFLLDVAAALLPR